MKECLQCRCLGGDLAGSPWLHELNEYDFSIQNRESRFTFSNNFLLWCFVFFTTMVLYFYFPWSMLHISSVSVINCPSLYVFLVFFLPFCKNFILLLFFTLLNRNWKLKASLVVGTFFAIMICEHKWYFLKNVVYKSFGLRLYLFIYKHKTKNFKN